MSKRFDKKSTLYFTITPLYFLNLNSGNNCDDKSLAWDSGRGFIPDTPLPTYVSSEFLANGVDSSQTLLYTTNNPLDNPNQNVLDNFKFKSLTSIALTVNILNEVDNVNEIIFLNITASNISQDFFKVMKLTNLETKESRSFLSKDTSFYGDSNISNSSTLRFGNNFYHIDKEGAFYGWSILGSEAFFKIGDKMKLTLS